MFPFEEQHRQMDNQSYKDTITGVGSIIKFKMLKTNK
jgi:hypothetical protein